MRKIIASIIIALAFQASAATLPAGHTGKLPQRHTICLDDYSWRDMALAIDTKDNQMSTYLFEQKKCYMTGPIYQYTVLDYDPYYYYYKIRIWVQGDPVIVYTRLPNQS